MWQEIINYIKRLSSKLDAALCAIEAIPEVQAINGLSMEGTNVVLGDDAAGTTELGVLISDRFINQDGYDVSFRGVLNGRETIITLGGDGLFTIDNEAGELNKYILRFKPLQQTEGNTNFNTAIGTFTNAVGARNNDVLYFGWNVSNGGGPLEAGKSMLALAFENLYNPAGTEYSEFHLLHTDKLGVNYRPITFFLNSDDGTLGNMAIQMPEIEFRLPNDTDPYFEFTCPSGTTSQVKMLDPVSTKGAALFVDPGNNNMQIFNVGMTSPTLYVNSFEVLQAKKIIITNSYGGDSDKLLGVTDGFGNIEYVTLGTGLSLTSDVLNLDIQALPVYADEAAAVIGGLAQYKPYRTATGELRYKL